MIIDIYLNLFNVKRILFGVPFLGGSTLLLFYSVVCFTVYLSNHVKKCDYIIMAIKVYRFILTDSPHLIHI